ncbi:hypothetical protein FIBSPDRAFT_290312 [Athelia psychrophila]|uniref:Uncharacterized protein n=1 Tax=Athelia psychrophila TaxID=1759441 RepID=A0A167XID4_9AGAM|nr:hypothetical protein FIBSPDRAFT_290312 [Fibularhizoctonia sp. CBS 109695]
MGPAPSPPSHQEPLLISGVKDANTVIPRELRYTFLSSLNCILSLCTDLHWLLPTGMTAALPPRNRMGDNRCVYISYFLAFRISLCLCVDLLLTPRRCYSPAPASPQTDNTTTGVHNVIALYSFLNLILSPLAELLCSLYVDTPPCPCPLPPANRMDDNCMYSCLFSSF